MAECSRAWELLAWDASPDARDGESRRSALRDSACGRPAEEPHRKDITEFKRKSLSEITDLSGMEQLLEPVRLAPSAVNRQPWHLLGSAYSLRLCCKKNNILQKAMFGDMPYMDMGIALCHLWLSAEKENRFLSFERETNPKGMPNGYEYVWTVHLKS